MTQKQYEIIDGIGLTFRFITPALLLIIGFFITRELQTFDKKFDSMGARFLIVENKLDVFSSSYHEFDKRIDRLEFRSNTQPTRGVVNRP